MARSRVELFEAIRRDYRRGVSLRGLSERYGVHRRVVRQAVEFGGAAWRRALDTTDKERGRR